MVECVFFESEDLMLEINQLSIHHFKDSKPIITDLHLIVNPGEKLAIIGEEGTGKSSLLKTIVSPKLIASYADYTGQIRNQFKKKTDTFHNSCLKMKMTRPSLIFFIRIWIIFSIIQLLIKWLRN